MKPNREVLIVTFGSVCTFHCHWLPLVAIGCHQLPMVAIGYFQNDLLLLEQFVTFKIRSEECKYATTSNTINAVDTVRVLILLELLIQVETIDTEKLSGSETY